MPLVIAPGDSLHQIKDRLKPKNNIAEDCQLLIESLDELIENTRSKAPKREHRITLQQSPRTKGLSRPEDLVEEAIWRLWRRPSVAPVIGAWHKIIAYQVPLKNKRGDKDWGEIDLLGVSSQGLPMIVEVKAAGAKDAPQKCLVQAVAYGIAFQMAWPHFRNNWQDAIKHYGFQTGLSNQLATVPVVCVAPKQFWDRVESQLKNKSDREAINDLIGCFAACGFPAHFVSVECSHPGADRVAMEVDATIRGPFIKPLSNEPPAVPVIERRGIWTCPESDQSQTVTIGNTGRKNTRIKLASGETRKVPNEQLRLC